MEVAMAQEKSPNQNVSRRGLNISMADLAGEIAALPALDPAALRQQWKDLLGTEPSPLLGHIFMVRAIAYRLQERRFGGLKPSLQRLLARARDGRPATEPEHNGRARTSAGPCCSGNGEA
jgi:hypothetical protein